MRNHRIARHCVCVPALVAGACIGFLSCSTTARAAIAALPPAHVTATCSQRQPPVDLSRFAGTTAHIVHPRIAYRAFPNYPASLITQAVHGLVSICVLVDERGQPAKPTILYSSGSSALDTNGAARSASHDVQARHDQRQALHDAR